MMIPKGQVQIAFLKNIYRLMKGYVRLLKACLSDFQTKTKLYL